MEQLSCPNCGSGHQGVLVRFPDTATLRQVQGTLAEDFRPFWYVDDDKSIWFHLKFVYDCLPYWQEFYDLSVWKARRARRLPNGTLHYENEISWQELDRSRPSLFVEDLVHDGRIRMMMQPIVNVGTGGIMGYEMLARGLNPDDTIIPPKDMYDKSREQNQLFKLDRACRMTAIEAAAPLPEDKMIFINFVPTSIYAPEHCLATTVAVADKLGIKHSRICFEVVETDRVQDLNHLRRILDFYRATGFRCALDDFGEGFSDTETMNALHPDIIKLDRKYVTNIHLDKEKQRMAHRTYQQGQPAGATMLAEGIECEEEAVQLAELGYLLQQGYWYGRPNWNPVSAPDHRVAFVDDVD